MKAVSVMRMVSLLGLATAIASSGKGGGLSLDLDDSAAAPAPAVLAASAPSGAALASAPSGAHLTPVQKVIQFLSDLRDEAIAEKKAEATAYGHYEAWCNRTIVDTTQAISRNKETLETAQNEIERLSGTLATVLVNIKNAQKQLAQNKDRLQEATAIREQEVKEFVNTTDDLATSIKGLKEVVTALGGNASNPGSFLAVSSHSRPERASALLQQILQSSKQMAEKLSEEKLELLQSFVGGPVAYESATSGVAGVVQQTLTDLEEDHKLANEQEDAKKKVFSELVATLKDESAQLEKSIADDKKANAEDLETYNSNTKLKDDTEAEFKANEKLLKETQLQCKVKAENLASRAKLRDEEIDGVKQAIKILTDPNATKTFEGSATVSFIQMSSLVSSSSSHEVRKQAYASLKALASKHHAVSLAQIASDLNSGGAFRAIVLRIDRQIEYLRKEEKDDLKHRKRCQEQQRANEAELASLADFIKKTGIKIDRLTSQKEELQEMVRELTKEMNETKKEMADRSTVRKDEYDSYVASHKEDEAALALLKKAKAAVSEFYVKNNKEVPGEAKSLLAEQAHKRASPPPKAGFDTGDYGGKKDATNTLMTLFDMVTDDLANEINKSEIDDAEDQKEFEEGIRSLTDVYDANEDKKIAAERRISETEDRIASEKGDKGEASSDKDAETAKKATLASDCDWVKTKFASRREKRKGELEGLVEAKGVLTSVKEGAGSGS